MKTKVDITFADLSHTGKTIDTNYFPLGIAYVASYAMKVLGDAINVKLFKYPHDLSKSLDDSAPQIACFTNFSWNFQLSYEFAKQIKLKSPKTITVFGGANYSNIHDKQKEFLRGHPYIDFYVEEEGELSFANLLSELLSVNLDMDQFIKKEPPLKGIHYYKNNNFIRNERPPRISDVSIIPSPILSGLMDKFIEDGLIPMVQTTRGCPYSCTFCHDGTVYQNKLKRFPRERYEQEIEYLAQRTKVPYLCIPDLNFGIFEEDYETARYISQMQKKYDWPKYLNFTTAKNNKERVSRIVEFLGDSYTLGISIQSTDKDVLRTIKRTNLPFDELVRMAKKSAHHGGNSASEVILCLPGDSKKAHFKTIADLLEAGIDEVRIYQFILLEGTEGGSEASKKKFEYQTKWRVLPRCFGHYPMLGKKCSVSEIHEVCVGNNTMPHQDYLDCRKLDLIIEIFNNGKIFGELLVFLESKGVPRSRIFNELFSRALKDKGIIGKILKEFELDERKNFFDSREELEQFLRDPDVIDKYISGEYGTNQIMRFRSEALIRHLEYSANMIFDIARDELEKNQTMNEKIALYLDELLEFVLATKGYLLSEDKYFTSEFHFDFVKLHSNKFVEDPLQYEVKDGIKIRIEHTDSQKDEINEILRIYGRSIDGLGHLIQRHYMFKFYRKPTYV